MASILRTTDEHAATLATQNQFLRQTLEQAVALIADYAALFHRYDARRARQVLDAARVALAWSEEDADDAG